MTIKVALREKKISKGRLSLYLDFYPAIPHPKTGKPTRREFLKLYVFQKAKDPIDKQHNQETRLLAKQICQKRHNFLNKPEIYTGYEKERLRLIEIGERSFIAYFQELTNKRKASNHDNWIAALKHFKEFADGDVKFSELNERFCNDFKDYLLDTQSHRSDKVKLSQNTALAYFNKFKATLKQAYKDDLLQKDLNSKVESIKEAETRREFLTLEEANLLIKTPFDDEVLKRAALFSILTGLRFSDIKKLTWKELTYIEGDGWIIQFTQKKTKGIETLPISEQAYHLLGERQNDLDQVFKGLDYSAYRNKKMYAWIKKAGISKKIQFHCFRHTYAVLQLLNGTNIFTLMKLMGHRSIKTTLIYAKVVDETKRVAANRIVLDFETPKA